MIEAFIAASYCWSVQHSPKRQQKQRRLQHFTALSGARFPARARARSRLSQGRVWDKLTHWLQHQCPEEPRNEQDLALWYQRAILGVEPLQWLFEHSTQVLCTAQTPGRGIVATD